MVCDEDLGMVCLDGVNEEEDEEDEDEGEGSSVVTNGLGLNPVPCSPPIRNTRQFRTHRKRT